MAAPVLQFKRGALANLPGLRAGEPALTTDSFDLYVGIDSSVGNNKFFGSHRYWNRETTSRGSSVNLVEGTSNGSSYVSIKSPDSLSGIVTYTLPGTQGASSSVLTNDGNGNLTWASGSANPVFTGIATFTDGTNNILGNADTGAVQIDGGLGINKNLTVGGNLNVQGYTELVGVVTFRGGTINLGDNNTDDIVVAGEFKSSLIPTDDGTYDLGAGGKRWRQINVSGAATVGSLVCNDGSVFTGNVQIDNNLNVNGNITLGGTSIYHASESITIRDKDIILGVTTDTNFYPDTSTDNTANHGGIAVASTEGSPLVSLQAVGVNSLPDTYKQFMWVKNGTFAGLGTDAWLSNYAIGIGSTQVPNGVRLAVGSVQITDDTVNAAVGNFGTLSGSLTGTISTATRATTVDTTATSTNADYYVTFVDTFAGQNSETLRVGAGLSVNPSNGDVKVAGSLSVGNISAVNAFIKAGGGSNALYLYSNGDVSFQAKAIVNEIRSSSDINTLITLSGLSATFSENVRVVGILTANSGMSVGPAGIAFSGSTSGNTKLQASGTASGTLTLPAVTDTLVGKATTDTFTNKTFDTAGTGNSFSVNGNQITSYTGSGNLVVLSNSPSFSTGINLNGGVSGQTTLQASGTASGTLTLPAVTDTLVGKATTDTFTNKTISLSNNTLTFTSSQLATACSDETGTGALVFANTPTLVTPVLGNATATSIEVSGNVNVGSAVSAPTIRANIIQSENTGATVFTLTADDAQVAGDLTVGGNLYVNGSTTQVNTASITVEDRTIELGVVDGSEPTTTTTWDLGVLFNYYDGSAKKSALVWEQSDSRFKLGSVVSDSGGSGNNNPQITLTSYAALEISDLWINNSCTGGSSQVIGCIGGELSLQNIVIDAGIF